MASGINVKDQNDQFSSGTTRLHTNRSIKITLFSILTFITSTPLLLTINGMMIVIFGFILYGLKIDVVLLSAASLVTFGVYGLNKFTDRREDSINRPQTIANTSKYYLLFSVASMLAGFLMGLMQSILALVLLFVPIIIGIIYSVQFSKSIPRLKEIVGIKSLVVAISWALTGSFLPASLSQVGIQAITIFFVYVFIKIFTGTILCDVLDTKGDLAADIQTIPTRLLEKETKKLLIIINSFGMLLVLYCIIIGIFLQFIPALFFGILYGYLAIWYFFRKKRNRLIAGLMMDGEWLPIVIMAALIILIK